MSTGGHGMVALVRYHFAVRAATVQVSCGVPVGQNGARERLQRITARRSSSRDSQSGQVHNRFMSASLLEAGRRPWGCE